MKELTRVHCSKGVLGLLSGLKPRIHSIKSAFTTLALLMVCLFGVNESAWATWPTYSGTITTPDNGVTYYVLVDNDEHTLAADFGGASHEYNLGGPSGSMTFYAMKSGGTGSTDLYLKAFQDNTDKGVVWHGNPAGEGYKAFVGYTRYGNIISVDDGTINRTANKLRFYTPGGGTLSKKFKEVKVKMFSGTLDPSTSSLQFGAANYNTTGNTSAYTQTFEIDWSNIAEMSISGLNNTQFSAEISNNSSVGNYGTATVTVTYKHDKVGTHNATLTIGGKSVSLSGSTNKITPYIVTTPPVDPITYGQTISNSQLGAGLVKADLINAAGTVVPGTWTIDEAGNTVSTSGGSNTTVNLTFTPDDQNTYNVLHTTQTMFVRSVATISWESAYSAEKPTVPVGKWIENAATTNAAGAVITYSSTSSKVEISADGHSFRFTEEGEAEVVASHGVTATHGSASETKTFKSTYKAIQVIKWADRFDRLTTEMTSKSLIAEVWIENALTGVRTPSAERTALLQYSSANSSVVSILVNSTTLLIEGKGTTTITAFVEGDEYYEEASVTMPVKVREPSDGCDYPLWEKDHEGDKDHLYEFFQMNKDEIISPEYDIRMEGQYPDKLSFGHKGEYYNVVGISFWKYYSGPIKAQQKIGNNWVNVTGSEVTPAISDWGETSDLQLDERATHIRFVRPQGGEGHHYIKNVTVSRKHFIRTETPEVDFGNTIKVNSSEYRDVVINYANVQDVLKVTNPFSQDITVDDVIDVDSCGAAGSAVLRIYFSPTSLATVDDYITIRDEVKNSTLSIHVKADAQRADQSITWDPNTELLATETIELNGTTNGQEHGQMNVIGYEVTNNDGVISVTNNVVTILKPGTVTITAKQNGSTNYAAATPVEKNFTISAEPLTLVAPTAQNITYGQALSESELTGGSAKDSKGNDVGGTFAWETASTTPNASDDAQAFTVVFTPSENAEWYTNLTTDANINVAKADPAATVENVSFAYGAKAEDVALDGTGDGEWSWTDIRKGQVLAVDTYEMDVHFAPKDDANYNAIDKKITLTVTKADPVATVENVSFAYGTKAEDVALSGTGAGTWTWTDSRKDDVLAAGEYTMTVHFVPTDAANYNEKDATVTLTVTKANPDATVENVSFAYGTKAEDVTLVGTGAGNWTWTDSRKSQVLAVNTYEMNVHFAPTDATNYNTIDKKITLTVTKADPAITPQASAINYGQAISASTLSTASGNVAGNWSWAVDVTQVLNAGNHDLKANFTSNNANYNNLSDVDVTLTVNKATSVATPTAAAITAGQKVSASVLTNSGTAGTWSWDEAVANTKPAVGTYNYTVHFTPDNANYTTLTTTVSLKVNPLVNEFTNTKNNGDWSDPDNWENGVVPSGTDPDVIVSGDLEITSDRTVGNLTIEKTGSITVITGGTLTVKGESEYREEGYGDIHVMNDGALALTNSANLQVRHFTLDAKLAGKNNANVKEAAASGQVEKPSKLAINGDAYFQMTFDPKGKISFGWYDFVVPFPVNISDGIFREGDLVNHLVSGVDFLVQEYSETRNANMQKAWSNFSGTMQPGRVYTITFNYDPTFDQNVFVFKKASGATIGGPTKFDTQYTEGSGTTDDFGWNGLGNGMLQHGYITGTFARMQVYNHAENKYDLLTGKNPTFAIGTSFFVQVDYTTPTMTWNPADANENHPLYAPKRETFEEVDEFLLSLRDETHIDACDHLYFSGSEEATEAYVIGHDLRKMGNPTEAKVAQMWATKNGKKLCDIETRMVNYGASTDLNFFAPNAGQYILAVEETPEDGTLYLTYNGNVIWDLTASPYVLDLTKGTTTGYGLRIEAANAPQITTGVEDVQGDGTSVRKVIIDNTMYIITPEGVIYNVIGKKVQ